MNEAEMEIAKFLGNKDGLCMAKDKDGNIYVPLFQADIDLDFKQLVKLFLVKILKQEQNCMNS